MIESSHNFEEKNMNLIEKKPVVFTAQSKKNFFMRKPFSRKEGMKDWDVTEHGMTNCGINNFGKIIRYKK